MKLKAASFLLAILLILAACNPTGPIEADWCYTYDFTESDYDINIMAGSWVDGEGIQADSTGLLQANWVHSELVTPAVIVVKATRPAGTVGDVTVTANAIAFGVAISFTETLPAAFNEVIVPITPETAGESGTSVNFTLDASQPLTLESVEIRGQFDNPFPINYCGDISETPTVAMTNTPSPAPTNTVTPGPSPTPTATPNTDSVCFDFRQSDQLWVPVVGSAEWVSGEGFEFRAWEQNFPNSRSMGLDYEGFIPQGATVTAFRIYYSSPNTVNINYMNLDYYTSQTQFSVLTTFPLPIGLNVYAPRENLVVPPFVDLKFFGSTLGSYNGAGGYDGDLTIHSICLEGQNLPEPYEPTPTPSPIPSRTPFPTFMPPTQRPTRTPIVVSSPTPQMSATPSTTPSPAPSSTPAPTTTPLPTSTPFILSTPDPGDPNPNPDTENEAEFGILDSINNFFDTLEQNAEDIGNVARTASEWASRTAQNSMTEVGNLGAAVRSQGETAADMFSETYNVGQMATSLFGGAMNLGLGWFSGATTRLSNVFTGFFNAPARTIPGLPLCITAPLESDLCAFWYILDWTIFAPNTPGAYFVPILTAVLNIAIVLYFIDMILKAVKRIESITEVAF